MTTSLDIWINRRPEDVLADRIAERLNVKDMTAAERRDAMNKLRRRFVTMAQLRRRVHADRPKSTGGAARDDARLRTVPVHHVNRAASPDPRTKLHDPLGSCATCKEYRRTHPGAALTASGAPEGAHRTPGMSPRAEAGMGAMTEDLLDVLSEVDPRAPEARERFANEPLAGRAQRVVWPARGAVSALTRGHRYLL
jgi:hypothetical protein